MKKITNYKVEYAALKKAIRKSMLQGKGIDFEIDFAMLNAAISEMEITAVEYRTKSKKVNPDDIPYLGEFFRTNNLTWINKHRQFSSLVFICNDAIDDEARELLENMKKSMIDDPDLDKVEILATILSKYPCYVASIVSYKSSDPKKVGLLCSEIICKANTVTIMRDNATYHKPENESEETDDEILDEE